MKTLSRLKTTLLVCAAAALIAGTAWAQPSADATSTSNSGSSAVSGSSSRATSSSNSGGNRTNQTQTQQQGVTANTNTGVTLNQTSTTPDRQTLNNNLGGGTNNSNTNWQGGHTTSDVVVRTTPTVYAPPVSGGNPCTLAVSGGVSVIGWGASAGGTFVDQDCANRQKIAMIHNAGYQVAARELMCNDRDTYLAFRGSATPCGFRAQFEPQGATPPPVPMVQQAPVQITPTGRTAVQVVPGRDNLPRCRGPNDQGPCFSG